MIHFIDLFDVVKQMFKFILPCTLYMYRPLLKMVDVTTTPHYTTYESM